MKPKIITIPKQYKHTKMTKTGTIVQVNDSWVMYNEDEINVGDFYISNGLIWNKGIITPNKGNRLIASETPTEGLALLDKKNIEEQINKPKYRVGKNQGRAILLTETGQEYLVFPVGKEKDCQDYCDYLNRKEQINEISEWNIIDLAYKAYGYSAFNISLVDYKPAFICGFNKAIELNKDKVFTLKEARKFWTASSNYHTGQSNVDFNEFARNLQSPKQQYTVEYEEEFRKTWETGIEYRTPKLTNGFLHVKIIK